ncbi:hypothetical protein SAMN00017405_1992 [Desulfonispora thiosulfatigenes DSM 11270]|uniref:Zn-finger containing protein n=1 Tax=Desulfonispora thiosulfatigenes DSM 11270 TaxID=656914 RepID=A0A1W1UI48_DESTI|nr:hypothetical protein [Desulfonispora thiosulfatigenes]SMB80788.1 hypothetical protein SAMN00017405_1992 [Desulfonispora thiosulfatigenes DSM 11270]
MNWLRKFMIGRYGGDQLSIFLVILSVVLTFIPRITEISALIIISYIPSFIAIYRVFSKDIQKRSMENYKFAIIVSPIYSKLKKTQNRIKDSKTHKYYTCTKCKTTLRVPKGKGKIMVTCPKCKENFTRKT